MSDIDLTKKTNKNTAIRYLFASAFCLVFGLVYEMFSNEVYSIFMLGAFAIPLVGGAVPFFCFSLTKMQNMPSLHARYIYHSGIATLTVGSIVKGVLDISGTTNNLMFVYLYVGTALLGAGIVSYIVNLMLKKQSISKSKQYR